MPPACPVTEGMINSYGEPRAKLLSQLPAEAVGSIDKMLMVHWLLKGQGKKMFIPCHECRAGRRCRGRPHSQTVQVDVEKVHAVATHGRSPVGRQCWLPGDPPYASLCGFTCACQAWPGEEERLSMQFSLGGWAMVLSPEGRVNSHSTVSLVLKGWLLAKMETVSDAIFPKLCLVSGNILKVP